MSLAGRLALITGGGSGIGRATCLTLLKNGARVAAVDVNLEGARQTCRDSGGESNEIRGKFARLRLVWFFSAYVFSLTYGFSSIP